jgi:hypothetical protein
MPRKKTTQQSAAGRLVSAIQKVQSYRSGTDQWNEAQVVMDRAHALHQASIAGNLALALAGKSIAQYLDSDWVACHPGVVSAAQALEAEV